MDGKCSLKTQCSSDKWQWCVVPRTTCVKDTSAQCLRVLSDEGGLGTDNR